MIRRCSAILVVAACFGTPRMVCGGGADTLERDFKRHGKLLLAIRYRRPPETLNARGVMFAKKTLATHELYLKHNDGETYIYVAADGRIRGRNGVAPLRQHGELLRTHGGDVLFIDRQAVPLDLEQWQVFWVAATAGKPNVEKHAYPRVEEVDGFMRSELLRDSGWRIDAGSWALNQHGGGMAETQADLENYNHQRAVNPFSVIGTDNGVLSIGGDDWINTRAEAAFYFGVPRTAGKHVVDTATLPSDADMLVAQGAPDAAQVAFGWQGRAGTFVLRFRRHGEGTWETLWHWQGKRPPLTNWVRLGLATPTGAAVEGWLDGVRVVRRPLPERIDGPVHVLAGAGLTEFDDFCAVTLPAPAPQGDPIFLPSRQFSDKQLKKGSDSAQFERWTRGSDAFVKSEEVIDEDWCWTVITTRMPLMGDFTYTTVPYDHMAGKLTPGVYQLRFCRRRAAGPADEVLRLEFLRDERGWSCPASGKQLIDVATPRFGLRIRRRAADGHCLMLRVGDRWWPLSDPAPEPLFLAVARLQPRRADRAYARPEHHAVFGRNVVNELFETAPSEWSWIEGAFRMDSRWACQDQWNFLACGGLGVPFMVSKKTFGGDQEHEYFMSLRPVYPWDAGDRSFRYDRGADARLRMFRQFGGWYNRRDLNFSFCCDGRNPLSGYAVIFGGDDNCETRLLRRGRVVATSPRRLPPGHGAQGIHWGWWQFNVARYGALVRVKVDGQPLFEYADPEPLAGGHVGFWTVRNGFVVSRIVSTAAMVERQPQVLYIDPGDSDTPWRPLLRDSVTIRRHAGDLHTEVTCNIGAGFHGVRYCFPEPVGVAANPIFKLHLRAEEGARVNVYLRFGGESFVIRVTAPISDMKSLLTSAFERGEQFQRPTWAEGQVRRERLLAEVPGDRDIELDLAAALTRLGADPNQLGLAEVTVGNTSNTDYLLAGNGGNAAGTTFFLGIPTLAPRR